MVQGLQVGGGRRGPAVLLRGALHGALRRAACFITARDIHSGNSKCLYMSLTHILVWFRALQALAAAGADPPCCSNTAPRRAGLFDMASGRLFPHRTGRAHIVDRRMLGAELVAEAERLYPHAVTFHFKQGLSVRLRPHASVLFVVVCAGPAAKRSALTTSEG